MKLIKLPPMGLFEVTSYIVMADNGEAVLVDCPHGAEKIIKIANENNAVIKKILITHGHFDHIESLKQLSAKTKGQIYIHEGDVHKLNDPRANLSTAVLGGDEIIGCDKIADIKAIKDGDVITLNELEFKVLHTPGHTMGGVCYILDDLIFTGDTLFYQSIGRTDFPDGDYNIMLNSLKKIADLKNSGEYDNYRILPGHGDETSLNFETLNNPYLMPNC